MPRWTPEARKKQSEAIRKSRPWEKSTGAKTEHGKRMSARNHEKACHILLARGDIAGWKAAIEKRAKRG